LVREVTGKGWLRSQRNARKRKTKIQNDTRRNVRSTDILFTEERYNIAIKKECEYFEYINVIRYLSRKIMVKVKSDT